MSGFRTKGMQVDDGQDVTHAVRAIGGSGIWYVEPNRTFCRIDLRPFHPGRARITPNDPDCPLCLLAKEPGGWERGYEVYEQADHKQPVPA